MQIIGKMHMECTGNKVGLASRRNFTDKCIWGRQTRCNYRYYSDVSPVQNQYFGYWKFIWN